MVIICVYGERNARKVHLDLGSLNILYWQHLSSIVSGAIGLPYDGNIRGLMGYSGNEGSANVVILISFVFLVSMLLRSNDTVRIRLLCGA
jgi:hypothetical protein